MKRRDILQQATGVAFFSMASSAALPDSSLHDSDPELYWKRIRAEQFLLPDWRVFLNNGSLGVAPKPVLAAQAAYESAGAARTTDEYPRWGYETLDAQRAEMAAFVGCHKDELAFTHNCTESMSIIANGLDLKAGDEILMTDQEHPSGRGPWYMKQARYGVEVREVALPLPPKSSGELADKVISAIGPKTRVISFSGILTTTGMIMPVREICDAARAKGIISVVDGAHMTGQIAAPISEMNCDFFAGSPHKWLFAPPGCGLLYIREAMLERLWPGTVTGNWDDKKLKAARFMQMGTNNRAIFEGMLAGLRFHKAVGSERIYKRIHSLAKQVYDRASKSPRLELLTPLDDRLYGSLATFRIKTKDLAPFWAACAKKRIWVIKSDKLRVSSHIHTRPSDINTLFETIEDVYGKA